MIRLSSEINQSAMAAILQQIFYGLILAITIAASVVWAPKIAVGVFVVFSIIAWALYFRHKLPQMYLAILGFCLAGYSILGRGFAYIGLPPLFIGEIILAIGILALLIHGGFWRAFYLPLAPLIIVFVLVGVANTLPYVADYGINALRDAAIWGYSIFAIFVAVFLKKTGQLLNVARLYARFLPIFLLLIPVVLIIHLTAKEIIPLLPGSGHPLIFAKKGDVAVHLAGALSFLLLGLHRSFSRSKIALWVGEWLLWPLFLISTVIVASMGRAAILSIIVTGLVTVALEPSSKWGRPIYLALLTVLTLLLFNLNFSIGGRNVSVDDLFLRMQSIVVSTGEDTLDGTRRWRLAWWGDIFNYTIFGEYFWTGKGYGINLADADGYQVTADGSLRSPHNGHLTILARSGVPGALAWLLLQISFAISILRVYFRYRHANNAVWAKVTLWILAYWAAFIVNASFDVFLEGPQGGIWFWSLFGFGIAVLNFQNATVSVSRVAPISNSPS